MLGLEGVFQEQELPLLIRREGMVKRLDETLQILDRRQLPGEIRFLNCSNVEQAAEAIENMVIQGAFSISIVAGYALTLLPWSGDEKQYLNALQFASERLIKTRPTGLALKRMMLRCGTHVKEVLDQRGDPQKGLVQFVDRAAEKLAQQGWRTGEQAAELLADGDTVLTHCFPDRSYAYMLMALKASNKKISVVCSETRPYLQGAKLTALCAHEAGFETSVITDGMGGYLMQQGEISVLITAADRVCMDGSVCNKVGTYQYALAAQANGIPYYVLRQSGPDIESKNPDHITVEMRDGEEIVNWGGQRTTPVGVSGLYPSFDITPPELVSGIVTDRGVFPANDIPNYVTAKPYVLDAIV